MEYEMSKNGKIPVWIIDDNQGFCLILSESLKQSDTVECTKFFHACKPALQVLPTEVPRPRVILLDIKMPRMSGLDAIGAFKRIDPEIHILMLTSHDLDENIRTAMNRGASGYLLKSSTMADIIQAIENVERGGIPLDPMVTKRIMHAFLGENEENPYRLTRRERDILNCVAAGQTSIEVAQSLSLSFYTVETHVKNIFQKLNVHSRHALVTKANKERLI
jgi:DNA-binding NarL/FixJ family response regulator